MNERSILGGRKRGTDHWATAAPQQSFGNRILPFRAAAAPPRRQQLRLKPPPDSGTVIFDEADNFLSLREIQPWLMTFADTIEESGGGSSSFRTTLKSLINGLRKVAFRKTLYTSLE